MKTIPPHLPGEVLKFSLETLEDRTMLAVDFGAIADSLHNSSALVDGFIVQQADELRQNFANNGLGGPLTLPLVNQTIGDIVDLADGQASDSWAQPVVNALQTIASHIAEPTNLNPNAGTIAIRNAVFDAIDQAGLSGMLQTYDVAAEDFGLIAQEVSDDPRNMTNVIFAGAAAKEIEVRKQGDNVQISLTLGFLTPDLLGDSRVDVDLGLPSLPLFGLSASDIDLHLGALVHHLTFGITNGQTFVDFIDLRAGADDVVDGVTVFTHASFDEADEVLTGQLGFLQLDANDVKGTNGIGSSLAMGFEFDAGWDMERKAS